MPERFDVVIFDLGNTLIYFDGDWTEVLHELDLELWRSLVKAGIPLEKELFITEFRNRMDAYYAERETEHIEYTREYILRGVLSDMGFPKVPQHLLKQSLSTMSSVSQKHWHRLPDTFSTLHTLKERGYRLGLISNSSDDEDVQVLIDNADLRSYFDIITTSAAEGVRKPHTRIFLKVLSQMNVLPIRSAMVGDSLEADILGAKNTGMFSIWFNKYANAAGYHTRPDLIQPDSVIHSLSDLLNIF